MNSIRFPQSHDFDDFDDEEFAREWAAGRESIGGSAPAEETALEGWVNQPATAGPEGDAGVEQADQWVAETLPSTAMPSPDSPVTPRTAGTPGTPATPPTVVSPGTPVSAGSPASPAHQHDEVASLGVGDGGAEGFGAQWVGEPSSAVGGESFPQQWVGDGVEGAVGGDAIEGGTGDLFAERWAGDDVPTDESGAFSHRWVGDTADAATDEVPPVVDDGVAQASSGDRHGDDGEAAATAAPAWSNEDAAGDGSPIIDDDAYFVPGDGPSAWSDEDVVPAAPAPRDALVAGEPGGSSAETLTDPLRSPTTPASPATPGTPASPGTPVTAVSPGSPVTPASPPSPLEAGAVDLDQASSGDGFARQWVGEPDSAAAIGDAFAQQWVGDLSDGAMGEAEAFPQQWVGDAVEGTASEAASGDMFAATWVGDSADVPEASPADADPGRDDRYHYFEQVEYGEGVGDGDSPEGSSTAETPSGPVVGVVGLTGAAAAALAAAEAWFVAGSAVAGAHAVVADEVGYQPAPDASFDADDDLALPSPAVETDPDLPTVIDATDLPPEATTAGDEPDPASTPHDAQTDVTAAEAAVDAGPAEDAEPDGTGADLRLTGAAAAALAAAGAWLGWHDDDTPSQAPEGDSRDDDAADAGLLLGVAEEPVASAANDELPEPGDMTDDSGDYSDDEPADAGGEGDEAAPPVIPDQLDAAAAPEEEADAEAAWDAWSSAEAVDRGTPDPERGYQATEADADAYASSTTSHLNDGPHGSAEPSTEPVAEHVAGVALTGAAAAALATAADWLGWGRDGAAERPVEAEWDDPESPDADAPEEPVSQGEVEAAGGFEEVAPEEVAPEEVAPDDDSELAELIAEDRDAALVLATDGDPAPGDGEGDGDDDRTVVDSQGLLVDVLPADRAPELRHIDADPEMPRIIDATHVPAQGGAEPDADPAPAAHDVLDASPDDAMSGERPTVADADATWFDKAMRRIDEIFDEE